MMNIMISNFCNSVQSQLVYSVPVEILSLKMYASSSTCYRWGARTIADLLQNTV